MSIKSTTQGWPQFGDLACQTALPVTNNASRTDGQTVISSIDAAVGQLLDDHNSRFVGGGTITYTVISTVNTLTFGERLDFTYNNGGTWTTIQGGTSNFGNSLGAGATITFTANGNMAYITLNRSAGTATLTTNATSLPAASSSTASSEIYLLAVRRDDISGVSKVYLHQNVSIYLGGSASLNQATTFKTATFGLQDGTDTTKQLSVSLSGATTGTTLTVASAQTTSQSLSIPNVGSGDSFVTNNTTASLSNKTLQNLVSGVTTDSTATGASATLGSGDLGYGIVRLTNASLTSLSGITAGASGQILILENQTGASVNILDNDSGATAANRIRTGTGSQLTMATNASYIFAYDSTAQRWMLAGGAGGAGGAVYTLSQANSFIVGTPVYLNSTTYTAAQANTAASAELVGLVSVAGSPAFQVTGDGLITGLTTTNFDEGALPAAGTIVFLSAANAGKLTVTEPTTIGNVSLPVGIMASTTSMYVTPKRGVVVGGTNARTQLSLTNNASSNVFNVTNYDAGELTGWVYISATTSYRFQINVQFAKNGAGTDYNVSYQTVGDTPPAGFAVGYTSPQITMTLPSVTGFVSAVFNYSLNAPAVGATFPLSVDASTITTGTVAAARLPVVVPGTSNGVISSNGVPGNTTGSAIAAGYVGEVLLRNSSATINGAGNTTVASLTLTVGVWLVSASAYNTNTAAENGLVVTIGISGIYGSVNGYDVVQNSTAANAANTFTVVFPNRVVVMASSTSNKDITLAAQATGGNQNTTCYGNITAVRIA